MRTNWHAVDGWPPWSAGTGARLSAQEIASTLTGVAPQTCCPAGGRSDVLPRRGPPDLLSQFLSHSPPSATVHRRPPRSGLRSSRTVADAGERWPALLESVLGASPREFESRILRHAELQEHPMTAAGMWAPRGRMVSLMVSNLAAGGAIAGISRRYCAWSQAPWTGLNGGTHAAEACALPFRAGRDHPRPAGGPSTYVPITLSDREVLGERAPSRPMGGCPGWLAGRRRRARTVVRCRSRGWARGLAGVCRACGQLSWAATPAFVRGVRNLSQANSSARGTTRPPMP
jgi:hypothetical protein